MAKQTVYFSDNFFSSGKTDIFSEGNERIGILDLKSAFSSNIDVLDVTGDVIVRGRFPFLSNKWVVLNSNDQVIGELKAKISLFAKKFQYHTLQRGKFTIESPAFSREYRITDGNNQLAAHFERVDSLFESASFRLTNHSENVSTYEWIAVIMGIHAIQQRRRSSAAAASS